MLLRKHISNSRITDISQPKLERIICFTIEHFDELGDLCQKKLIVEIMGKHSNIIFCSEDGTIIDSIKHVSAQMSSVREVLPGRKYFIPDTMHKKDPLTTEWKEFSLSVNDKPMSVAKALYTSFTGISPVTAEEICYPCRYRLNSSGKRIQSGCSFPSVYPVYDLSVSNKRRQI